MQVLDVGCGTGTLLRRIAPSFGKAVGIEFNDGMLGQAKSGLPEEGCNIELHQGSGDALPFDDASFHMVDHMPLGPRGDGAQGHRFIR